MQLHHYQQIVLDDLENYLRQYRQKSDYIKAYNAYWDEKPTLENGYICPPENRVYTDNIVGVPHVCVKVPTAGGKTFIACNALAPLFDENLLPFDTFRAVVWLVPSTTILKQTYDALNNPRHPYRLKINELFGGRVAVYKADELLEGQSFNPTTATDNLNIFVLSYQSIRAKTKDDRRIYSENGALMNFFSDIKGDEEWLMKEEDVAPYSLINVIRKMQPIVVIDEAHNAMSDLSKEMLQAVRPRFILELTATPRKDKKKENYVSNIISYVSSTALKQANMVKLPLLVYNHKTVEGIYDYAIDLQKELEELATAYPKHYLRPIVLLQAQPKSQNEEKETFERIKAKLIDRGIKNEQIRIKTAAIDEISQENLMDKDCVVRYIITVDALKEGWDCPFAYILASVANKTSEVAIEQIVGRVLRKPYARHHQEDLLNMSYVLTSSSEFQTVLKKIAQALNGQGFEKSEMQVINEVAYDSITLFSPSNTQILNPSDTQENQILESSNTQEENQILNPSDTQEISVKNILQEASAAYIESEKTLTASIQQGTVNMPDEAKSYNPMATIKTEFLVKAKAIHLPKFHFSIINNLGETIAHEVHFKSLLNDFDIMKKGVDIDFDALNIDLYEFDVRPGASMQVSESAVEYQKASDVMQKKFGEAIAHQSPQGQLNALAKKLYESLRFDYIEEGNIKRFVKHFLDIYADRLEDIKSRYLVYSQKIKLYIEQKAKEHAAKNFEKRINEGKITLQNSFSLSETIKPLRPESGIAKSLYEKYHGLNGDESKFISEITSLENILFWHKFGTRTAADFCINGGYMNHYPDFLIVTKSGNYIIVETKGDDRDNSDTKSKIRLGEKWATLAGANYQYFVAFAERNNVEGAVTFKEVISIVKNK